MVPKQPRASTGGVWQAESGPLATDGQVGTASWASPHITRIYTYAMAERSEDDLR